MYEAVDVIIQTTGSQPGWSTYTEFPPITGIVMLSDELWIGSLPPGQAGMVFDACDSPGLNFNPSRQYGCRYCHGRTIQSDFVPGIFWDEDQLLRKSFVLARLVFPVGAQLHYSARIVRREGEVIQIIPGDTHGMYSQSWIAEQSGRDWLITSEAETIRDLLPNFIYNFLPPRVRRALRHFNDAQSAYFLDQRTATIITAFEALLKTERNNLTQQFRKRVRLLAEMVGKSVLQSDPERFYDDRSAYVHGAELGWSLLDEPPRSTYIEFETLLRMTLLKAVQDGQFAILFATDDSVKKSFS